MPDSFWSKLPRPFFVLAPMADVTDVPFRSIVAECGRPDLFYTEFVSAHGLNSPGRPKLMRDLALSDADHPIVAQFFGTEPEHFYAAGKLARELGYDGVDVNMGCPDRSVLKQGAGIALAKDPARAQAIIHALREGFGGPTSVKTRLGLYRTDEMETWIPALLETKPDALIVHGRTMKEMSKVPAHWDLIGRVAQMARGSGTPVIGNGDIFSRVQGEELAKTWEVDGVMVGRGIFRNPWLFAPEQREHPPAERLDLALCHAERWVAHWGDTKSFDLMKKFFKAYVSEWPGAAELRGRMMECRDLESVRAVILDAIENL